MTVVKPEGKSLRESAVLKLFLGLLGASSQNVGGASELYNCFREDMEKYELKEIVLKHADEDLELADYEPLLECRFKLGDYYGVIDAAKMLASNYGDVAFLYHYMGKGHYGIGDYEKAIEMFRLSLSLDWSNYESIIFLSRAYERSGRLEDAISVLREMLGSRSTHLPAPALGVLRLDVAEVAFYTELSRLYEENHQLDEARKILIEGYARNAGSKKLYQALFDFLFKYGPAEMLERHKERVPSFLDG